MTRSKKCTNCIYFHGQFDENCCCNYIFHEGRKRPCPPGDGCTAGKRRPQARRLREDRIREKQGASI